MTDTTKDEQPEIFTEADLPKRDPYEVAGYGVKTPGYDGPYLDGHDFDPGFIYAMSGSPASQAKFQDDLKELADASDSSSDKSSLDVSNSGVVVTTEGPVETTALSAGGEVRKDVLYGDGPDNFQTSKLDDDDPRNPTNYETKPVDTSDALDPSVPNDEVQGNSQTLPEEGQPDNFYEEGQDPKSPTEVRAFDPPEDNK